MGFSRDSYQRFRKLYEAGGEKALWQTTHRKPLLKNRVDPDVEKAVVQLAIENPALGSLRASNELRKRGFIISPGGVNSVRLRHDLENFKKRVKALKAKVAQGGIVLTEEQQAALERAKENKKAHG